MRPRRISIEGLRSFRAKVEIDFGDRTKIAVIGDTGAGKSSILEAMTYALYGQTSVRSQDKQELMNDISDMMRVVLRFQIADEDWEVTRVDRRSPIEGLRPPKAQLIHYGPDGNMIEKVEQVRRVNDRVRALIGLDSRAFLRTVILPQGRFARLLVEDRPSTRTEMLRQVWRTQGLEAAGEAAGQQLNDIKVLTRRLKDEMQRHPSDPEKHLAQLSSEAREAKRKCEALARLHECSVQARDTVLHSKKVIAKTRSASERLLLPEIDKLIDRLAPMESTQREMDVNAMKLEQQEASLRGDLSKIPVDSDSEYGQVVRTVSTLEEIPQQLRKAIDANRELRRATAREIKEKEHYIQVQRERKSAKKSQARHQRREPPISSAVDSAHEHLKQIERRYKSCNGLEENIQATEGVLVKQERKMADVIKKLAGARKRRQKAQKRSERAERELGEAQRANAAATAARGLCPGDKCPICQNDLSKGWVPPQDSGLEATVHEECEAKRMQTEVEKTVAAAKMELKIVREQVGDSEKELAALRSKFADALERLRSAAKPDHATTFVDDMPLPEMEQVLFPARVRLRDAQTKLDEYRTKLQDLRNAEKLAQEREKSVRKAHEYAREDFRRTRNAVSEAYDALEQSIQSIPSRFRPGFTLPSNAMSLEEVDTEPINYAMRETQRREKILQQREKERECLRKKIDDTRSALKDLAETRKAQVEEPLRIFADKLNDHRIALATTMNELDADTESFADVQYLGSATKLREHANQTREQMIRMKKMADNRRQRAHVADDEARTEARKIAEQVDFSSDPSDMKVLVESIAKLATEARFAFRNTARDERNFAAQLDNLLHLKDAAVEAENLELTLSDLNAALKPGAFLKWLTLRRSRDLLVYASKTLKEMTANRFSFADPGNLENQQWLIVDKDSGQPRSPSSLSGGEQFIGSLALALGMVEMMARSGGRLESLFLDEGFGALDRNNLDSAIDALSLVAKAGRMVAVISHVGAVAEQIDNVLAVTRDATGSQVEWLSHSRRQALVLSEGSSALAGLLE